MITVYWTCVEPEMQSNRWVMRPGMQLDMSTFIGKSEELPPSNFAISPLSYFDPVPVRNCLQEPILESSYSKCPAFTAYTQNLFALKFPFDYKIELFEKDGSLVGKTEERDQTFFESYIKLMPGPGKHIFQVTPRHLFVSEHPLIMTLLHPFFHNNNITRLGHVLGGEFDIGQWARQIVMGMYLHEPNCVMDLKRGDVYTYLKFNTKDKVTLKKFHYTSEINSIVTACTRLKNTTKKVFSLKATYEAYKRHGFHKLIIKEIKKNLI